MAKLSVKGGTTSFVCYVFIQDSSQTDGRGLTGLAYNTASLVASYVRPLGSRTAITLATQTVTGAYSSGGFVEVDSTNMPGVYRLDIPDAALAAGRSVAVMLKGAANMAPCLLEIDLLAQVDAVAWNALPTVALPPVAGQLPAALVGGRVDASVGAMASGVINAAAYNADTNNYVAIIWLCRKGSATATDRWGVIWTKNGVTVPSGITSPLITVIKASDGTPLISAQPMTPVSGQPYLEYDAVGAERITAGEWYIPVVTATIDGSARTWAGPQSRDVAA